jgi:hypothetical protein
VKRLCGVVALGCVLGLASIAVTEQVAAAHQPGKTRLQRAEAAARAALAPLVVESALCLHRPRRRVLCLLRHPDVGELQCRSAVLLRGRRVHVIQSNVCFKFEVIQ